MAFQIRRGPDVIRQTLQLADGEIVWTTDTHKIYVGDGVLLGGHKVTPETTADIAEDSNYKFYTTERAQDDAASLFTTTTTVASVHSGITFAYNDSLGKVVATVPDKGTVVSGQAGEIATYNTTGTTISGTTGLVWDNNIRQMTLSNSSMNVTASTGNRSVIIMETNAPGTIGNNVSFARSRGTNLNPTSIQSLDTFGGIVFNGHDGTDFLTGASIYAYNPAGFPASTGVMPTAVNIALTDTTGINTTRLRVFPDGRTILGPFASTETGGGYLNVNSTTPVQAGILNPMIGLKTFLETPNSQRMTMSRYRGTPANPTKLEATDVIFNLTFFGYDGASATFSSQIQSAVDGPVSAGKVPGSLKFSTANANGVNTAWTKLGSDGVLTHTGGFTHTGVRSIAPNYATITTSSTVTLSTTTTNNVLLVGNSGLTVTLNMPTTPVDGQLCEFIVHSNNTTLALGTGTVLPSFAGSVNFGTAFKYVYRTSNATWYKLG